MSITQKSQSPKAGKYATVIDGKKVENIIDWAQRLVDEATQNREWTYANTVTTSSGTVAISTFADEMAKRLCQYTGDPWITGGGVTAQEGVQKVTENYLFPVIEIELAIMFANRPEISFRPTGVEDVPLVAALDKVVKKEQDKEDTAYDAYLVERGKVSKIFGSAIGFCGYTYLRNEPVGAHEFRVCDPLGFLWQSGKPTIQRSKYTIEIRKRDKVDVEAEFKVKLPEGENKLVDFSKYCLNEYMYGEPPTKDSVIEQVITVDIHYRDSTREKREVPVMVEAEDPLTGEVIEEHATEEDGSLIFDEESDLKYPGSRRIVICGKNVLCDKTNIYDHKMIPYSKADNYDVPGRFMGMSEFKQLEDMQDNIDELNDMMLTNAIKLGSGQYEVNASALADHLTMNDVTNETALMLERNKKNEQILHPIEKPQMSSLVPMLKAGYVKSIEVVSGASEVSRGMANPEDSGKKVANLDAYATRRMQNPVKHQERCTKREGLMLLKNIPQFLPPDTLWRVTGLENPEKLGLEPLSDGSVGVSLKDLPFDMEMDVDVVPMSSMPGDPEVKLKMLSELRALVPELPGPMLFKYAAILANVPELAEEYAKWKDAMDAMKGQVEGMSQRIGEATPEELAGVQDAMRGVEGQGELPVQ